jgi:hypothetical protein
MFMARQKHVDPFEEGQLVALKSDAFLSKKPTPMTVESIDDEIVTCVFRDKNNEIQRRAFKSKTLMNYEQVKDND